VSKSTTLWLTKPGQVCSQMHGYVFQQPVDPAHRNAWLHKLANDEPLTGTRQTPG